MEPFNSSESPPPNEPVSNEGPQVSPSVRPASVPIEAPGYSAVAAPPRRGRSISFWIAITLFLMLGFSVFLNMGLLMLSVAGSSGSGGTPQTAKKYNELIVEGTGSRKIVLIQIKGVIMDQKTGGSFFPVASMVKQAIKQLRTAANDPTVEAIVLSVNSPGGGVTASDIIYNEVKKVKAAGKTIVVHMGGICASGGYYISAPADHIMASPTTITGSIGVIMNTMDASELFKKVGVKQQAIKSGEHKDILSMSRPMSDSEAKILQSVIMDMYNRFLDIVEDGRKGHDKFPATRAELMKVADGSIYTTNQAIEVGLVDDSGYLHDAFQKAMDLCGISKSDVRIITYQKNITLLDALTGGAEGRTNVNLNSGLQVDMSSLLEIASPRFEYRWAPGIK